MQVAVSQLASSHCSIIKKNQTPETANVAIFATYKSNEQAIEDVCHYIENNLSDIIQLPELFFIADKNITNDTEQRAKIARLCNKLIDQISAELRPFQYVCTSLIIEGIHQAVLISEHGLIAKQQQLHACARYPWSALGDNINIIKLPLEQGIINIAMLTADDAHTPEIVDIAALNNIHVLLVPFDIQKPHEVEQFLLSRAAEHKICIVAASREKSFTDNAQTENKKPKNTSKVKPQKSTGFIIDLVKDNGSHTLPLVKHQHGKITKAIIHPLFACNKVSEGKV